jgi:hypothetical protein
MPVRNKKAVTKTTTPKKVKAAKLENKNSPCGVPIIIPTPTRIPRR